MTVSVLCCPPAGCCCPRAGCCCEYGDVQPFPVPQGDFHLTLWVYTRTEVCTLTCSCAQSAPSCSCTFSTQPEELRPRKSTSSLPQSPQCLGHPSTTLIGSRECGRERSVHGGSPAHGPHLRGLPGGGIKWDFDPRRHWEMASRPPMSVERSLWLILLSGGGEGGLGDPPHPS